jgi:hypothetical protein
MGRGHQVAALVRPGSEKKLPGGCETVRGDPLDGDSYAAGVRSCDTFVLLVGVAHPGPSKAALRLGLVTLEQMVNALASAVDHPSSGVSIVEVPQIRRPA